MKKYLVALCVGGIMEDPEISYTEYEIIEAQNGKEAVAIYNKKNNCKFYYGCLMATKTKNGVKVNNKGITYDIVEQFKGDSEEWLKRH